LLSLPPKQPFEISLQEKNFSLGPAVFGAQKPVWATIVCCVVSSALQLPPGGQAVQFRAPAELTLAYSHDRHFFTVHRQKAGSPARFLWGDRART
jgi:hypothetical protein